MVDQQTGVIWLPFTRDNDDVFITSSDDTGKTWRRPQQTAVIQERKSQERKSRRSVAESG